MPNLPGQTNELEQLAQLIMMNQPQQRQIPTVNIGGRNILVKPSKNRLANFGNAGMEALGGLAQNYSAMQAMQKRNQFLQGVQQIAQSQTSPDEKINQLVALTAQHGTDYGMGVQQIVQMYGQQANRGVLSNRFTQSPNGELQVPEGFEITGYDQKGQPMIRKIQSNLAQQKFDLEREAKTRKQETETRMIKESAQATLSTIDELKKGLKYFGAAGDLPPWPAEYSKKNWLANYNRLKDKLVVDLMLKLKSASATGSTGFGQLSEKEGMRLENAATALQKGLKEEDALRYLGEIEKSAKNILSAEGGAKAETPNKIDSLKSKYGLR